MNSDDWARVLERSRKDFERRRALATEVVEQVRKDVPPDVLLVLGRGMSMSDGAMGLLGGAFWCIADGSTWLAGLKMSVALDEAMRDDELLDRLGAAEDSPWTVVVDACRKLGLARAAEDGA
jgi:hypothetical protein